MSNKDDTLVTITLSRRNALNMSVAAHYAAIEYAQNPDLCDRLYAESYFADLRELSRILDAATGIRK